MISDYRIGCRGTTILAMEKVLLNKTLHWPPSMTG